uniref:CUB domain-containing protein n=1 Tax=Podarcis muralis TaxID=64176 RepID=A0A670ICB0_PODMU
LLFHIPSVAFLQAGLSATWWRIHGCGNTFSNPYQSFSGPYYNGDGSTIQCLWTIHSYDSSPIVLTLDYLNLDCTHEYVHVYDGNVYQSALLGNICSGWSWIFTSYTGTMTVLLHRESYRAGSGFFAYYNIAGNLGTHTFLFPTAKYL